ncbi:MAG: TRAP transporter substrate-binding protein [Planctomycetota bacterium]|jgi:tripartite ATP-independent transporter DctP family solute receptor|nr:TRAP transporter substrate-binding protein [Planctomycetota bacterium]
MKKMLTIAVLVLAMAGVSRAADPVLITVAHGATEDFTAHKSWLLFEEIVERDSNGALQVEIYPNQQMGGDREVIEATQLGNIQCGHTSLSPLASFAKEFYIWDTPFTFTDRKKIFELLDGAPGQKLMSYLEPINLKGMGFVENGFRNLTANKKVLSPDDLRGIKLRVMENKLQMLTWSSLGANPTPIAFGELFTALQQKTVDAQENPFELIYTNKFYEVQSHVMITNHIYSPMLIFINLEFFEGLAPGQRAIIMKAARESIVFNRKLALENEQKARDIIARHCTIVDLTPEQRNAFRDKMGPVYEEIRKQVNNDELVDLFLK